MYVFIRKNTYIYLSVGATRTRCPGILQPVLGVILHKDSNRDSRRVPPTVVLHVEKLPRCLVVCGYQYWGPGHTSGNIYELRDSIELDQFQTRVTFTDSELHRLCIMGPNQRHLESQDPLGCA